MNSAKNNKTNQNIQNNNQSKKLFDISSDLPVKSLYQILSKNPKLVNKVDDKGETLLTYSIKRKKIDVCQLILSSSILDLSYQDKNGNSYLHLAVVKQLEVIVKALIEKGIYINMQNNDGNTPLHFAYLYDSTPIIYILINNHIDTTIKNKDNKIAEDLKLYKDNNYYLEKDNNNNNNNKKMNKENKSVKKNKDMKSNNQKNDKNQKGKGQLTNNIETKTLSSNKKMQTGSGNISYNSSIKRILNKQLINKNYSTMKANEKLILKKYSNSPKAVISSEKKDKKRIIKNRMSPYINDKEIKKERSKEIIMSSHKTKNKKCKIDENVINKELKFIDIGKKMNNREAKYKTDLFKDKMKKIEGQNVEEGQKLNIKSIEDDIFNIAESIDYKQKLAHTSELNTQIVKSPEIILSKIKKNIKEDEFLNNNDDIVNLTDKKNNKKIINEEINDNINNNNKEIEYNNGDDEDYDNDEDYYNNFKFDEGYHEIDNNEDDDNNKDNEEDNEYDEDEILAQNKSSLNLFENSVPSEEHLQKKMKNNEFQGRNYVEFSKNGDIEIGTLTNEENGKMKTEINKDDSHQMKPFYSLNNEYNYNKNISLIDRNNFTLNTLNTYSELPKNQRKTISKFYHQNDENIMKYGFNPYMKDNYHLYTNIINNNNINQPSNNYSVIPQSSPHVNNTSDSKKIEKNYNPLKEFLSQINMLKYMNNFIQSGFDDIDLIIEQAQQGIYIKDSELKEAGITVPGDRAKILIRIQEKAGNFGFAVPKNVYYICKDLENIENDENIMNLDNWLKALKIEDYLMNFIYNGYYSIELLLLQMESKNPLTVEILKDEIGIDKIGHRSRIINKLKDEGRSYNNKLKTSVLIVGNGEKNKFCDCIIY